jgi:hypothetical protein
MRQYTRIVFGLNAVYQTVFGVFLLLAPATIVGLLGGSSAEGASELLQVAFRLLGVHLVPVGVVSAMIAGSPDDSGLLRGLMGLLAVLTLVCWGIVIGMQDLTAGWIAPILVSITAQTFILVGVVFYNPKKKVQQFITRKRIAA